MLIYMGFPYTLMGSSVVGDPPASAGDTGDLGSISGLGRFLEKEMATHSSILAWEIPWTEQPGGCRPQGHKEPETTLVPEQQQLLV